MPHVCHNRPQLTAVMGADPMHRTRDGDHPQHSGQHRCVPLLAGLVVLRLLVVRVTRGPGAPLVAGRGFAALIQDHFSGRQPFPKRHPATSRTLQGRA